MGYRTFRTTAGTTHRLSDIQREAILFTRDGGDVSVFPARTTDSLIHTHGIIGTWTSELTPVGEEVAELVYRDAVARGEIDTTPEETPDYYVEYTEGVWKGRDANGDRIEVDWLAIRQRGVEDPVESHEFPHQGGRMYDLAPTLESLGWRLTGDVKYIPGGPGTGTNRARVERTPPAQDASPAPELIDFGDVQVGDTLTFTTRDNGFGGTGGRIERTGAVTAKAARTITVKVTGYNPLNPTARLRAADWRDRNVYRTKKTDRGR